VRFRVAVALLALLGATAASRSQASAQASLASSVLQTYRFDDPEAAGLESIRLLATPFSVAVPLLSSVAIDVSGAYAHGSAKGARGEEATLSGLTDTYVGMSFGSGVEWLVISAGASLPTGEYSHSASESLVSGVLAAELLPFAVKTWGSGGSVGGSLAAVRQMGAWGLGFSGGYRVAGEYEPLQEQAFAYRPGDQLYLRLALDRNVGAAGTLSAVVGLQRFGNDEVGGNELFRSGSRVEAVMSYAFALGLRSSALVYGGVYHRTNGTLLSQTSALRSASDSPSQQLFIGGTNLRLPLGRRAALLPSAEMRVFRAEDGASQGWVASAGSALDVRLWGASSGRRLVLTPTAQGRLGRVIIGEGLETGLVGWEAGVVLRVELAP